MGKYNYKYEIDESGVVVLKGLPFKSRYVEVPREKQFRMLYSYVLVDIDLYYALEYLQLCSKTTNEIERQCFFRMAVIQYAKCYSPSQNGGRSQLEASKVYRGLPNAPIGCHDKFIAMRNKYFAHDENDFKAAKLGAVLNIEDRRVMGIAYPRMQRKFDYDATISVLMQLCQRTREWVQDKLNQEVDRISQYIEQRDYDVLAGYNDLRVLDDPGLS